MKHNIYTIILTILFAVSSTTVFAQTQIIINELSQGPEYDWEWIEYLVTADNTDIRGVYLDDDDAIHGTLGSAPLVQLKKDLPAFENVSKGSIIVIYKSPDSTQFNQQDPLLFAAGAPDTDFSDGVIIIPHTNTEFLEPNSWWPKFRSAGENLGIFDSLGTGIFGISYGDESPEGDFSNGWGMVNLPGIPSTSVGFYIGTKASTASDSTLWLVGAAALGTPGSSNFGQGEVPVEVTSFSASVNGNIILLEWNTATELNNYGFYIEKSFDRVNWNEAGFVKGSGNSVEEKRYSFVDASAELNSTNYYRLKQVDYNGGYSFSKVIEINPSVKLSFKLEQNYPNPFNPVTTIKFSIPSSSDVSLKIYNTLGEEVQTLYEGFLSEGVHSFSFNGEGLSSGMYIYKLKSGTNVQVKKMILMK